MVRPGTQQPAVQLDGIRWNIRLQQALPVGGRLTDQPLTEAVATRFAAVGGVVGVTGEFLEARACRSHRP